MSIRFILIAITSLVLAGCTQSEDDPAAPPATDTHAADTSATETPAADTHTHATDTSTTDIPAAESGPAEPRTPDTSATETADTGTTGSDGAVGETCGGIAGLACADDLFCELPDNSCARTADMAGICAEIPTICTREYDPVCGCDGETYSNGCEANAAGTSIASPGACRRSDRD